MIILSIDDIITKKKEGPTMQLSDIEQQTCIFADCIALSSVAPGSSSLQCRILFLLTKPLE